MHYFGKWKVGESAVGVDGGVVTVYGSDGEVIAKVFGKDEQQARADACSISLMPELYSAVMGAAVCLERFLLPPHELAAMRQAADSAEAKP